MSKIFKYTINVLLKRNFSLNSMETKRPIIRTALLQLKVGTCLQENLKNSENKIKEAKEHGAELVILPECFNSPYGLKYFEQYAETLFKGPTSEMLSKAAKENSVYLVGGTFPERDNSKLYNTCTVWDPSGEMIAKFRKMHLFDIEIPGAVDFKESEILQAGSELVTFCIKDVKIGLGICYDLRFEEFAKLYRLQNCDVLIYPAAFTMKTGVIHFELLQRGRALDNQVFIVSVSPASSKKGFIAWGHSQVTSPWGKVLVQAGHEEEILYCDLDLKLCDEVRQQIPIFSQRRCDVYTTILKEQ